MTRFVKRLIGAVVLDAATYEDVEADRSATWQAMVVVLLSAVATGVGARGFGAPLSLVPLVAIAALLTWAAWALLTYEIGMQLLPTADTRSDVGELLRTIGFASAPGIFRLLGVIPGSATMVFVLTSFWMLFAMVVAVRQALDYSSTLRALAVCVVGWTLILVFAITLGFWAGPILSAPLFAQHSAETPAVTAGQLPLQTRTIFDLRQRELTGPLVTAGCSTAEREAVDVPFSLQPGEAALNASASVMSRQSLPLGTMSVLSLSDRSVKLALTLKGDQSDRFQSPAPCQPSQALVTVRLDIISLRTR